MDDVLSDSWGMWLLLRHDFDLAAWDASAARLGDRVGARETAAGHRSGLLAALEARDDAAVRDKIELMWRTLQMAHGKRHAGAGLGTSTGGKKGSVESRKTRRGPGSKRAKIIAELALYKGPDTERVATVAKRARSSKQYVRRIMKKTGN